MPRVAALYVDEAGPYMDHPDVDAWPASRDARLYAGPWPVIAHPPCGPWGKLKAFCTKQDASLGPLAVDQVRRWGGILEHPVGSSLWWHCRLPPPGGLPDAWGGWTLRAEQCRWGHRAEKDTLFYMVGVDPHDVIVPALQGRRGRVVEHMGKPERRLTPPALVEWLIDLAAGACKSPG